MVIEAMIYIHFMRMSRHMPPVARKSSSTSNEPMFQPPRLLTLNIKNSLLRCAGVALVIGLSLVASGAQGSDLSDRLKSKHHVLLMRHAYAPGVGDPPGYSLQRCETQRTLNAQGMAQATRIGQWLRAQGVTQAQVLSSVWCRCQQTAERLNLGPVRVEPALASFFDDPSQAAPRQEALERLVAQSLAAKGDQALILVTHHVNIRAYVGRNIGSGDMVLAQVTPEGKVIDHTLYPSP